MGGKKKERKKLRIGESLADKFVMVPVDTSVSFSPAQLSSRVGAGSVDSWMDHLGCVW